MLLCFGFVTDFIYNTPVHSLLLSGVCTALNFSLFSILSPPENRQEDGRETASRFDPN